MDPNTLRPLSSQRAPLIEDLSAATIDGVADRLVVSSSFEDLVYRESEMDALFTLVDIAIHTRRGARDGSTTVFGDTTTTTDELLVLRDLIFRAHDVSHDNRVIEAAELLHQAARITTGTR